MLIYAEKRYRLRERLGRIGDARDKPRIPTAVVTRAVLALFLARVASLNALEQTQGLPIWKRWLGTTLPSADTLGRVFAKLAIADLREFLYALYRNFRRKKVLRAGSHGLVALIFDGHESHASYRRRCPGCLERRIQTAGGERIQYYHRHVAASLQAGHLTFLLDAEPVRAGEGEVSAARRLFDRLLCFVPRAFDVVVADALYAEAGFFTHVRAAGKHAMAVLKHERRDLLRDARGLFSQLEPQRLSLGPTQCLAWDQEGFTSWWEFNEPVRVVRSLEVSWVKRQKDEVLEGQYSEWFWVTTLPIALASTQAIVDLGHQRWSIENQGFNELVNQWHADHVFHHHPQAILGFCLMAFVAYNLFHAFVSRNLKPQLRQRFSTLHWARLMASDLYQGAWTVDWPLPP